MITDMATATAIIINVARTGATAFRLEVWTFKVVLALYGTVNCCDANVPAVVETLTFRRSPEARGSQPVQETEMVTALLFASGVVCTPDTTLATVRVVGVPDPAVQL